MASYSLVLTMAALVLLLRSAESADVDGCDFFSGSWVTDESYPLYDPAACPFIEHEFTCQKNGRPDLDYTKFRWQPHGCDLRRFDALEFLEKNRGKKIMFVGDSLSRNQWQSLTCMLHAAVPESKYTLSRLDDVSIFEFSEYETKVMLDRNVYLVDTVREPIGRILKLDSIEGGKLWKGVDTLIFNTWHWWNRRGPSQPWDYIRIGNETYKDLDRMVAFERALATWGQWIDTNIDPAKSTVFYQGISPSHYNGTLWNDPRAKSCVGETLPAPGSEYPGGTPAAVGVLKGILGKIKKPVTLLDITTLSLLRKDGHPSKYGLGGPTGMDCSHWCLSGVPDTWNLILFNLIM